MARSLIPVSPMSVHAVGGEGASTLRELDTLETGLAEAFSQEPRNDWEESGKVDAGLLNEIEAPAELDFAALEHEVLRHRRLVVRGQAGIPVTALIAIGGAILFHVLLVGVLLLGLLISVRAVAQRGGEEEGGRPGAGYMVSGGGGADTGGAEAAANSLQQTPQKIAPEPPILPPPPTLEPPSKTSVESIASALNPAAADPELIGIPAGGESRVGELRITPPARNKPKVKPSKPSPPALVPPPAAVVIPPSKATPPKTTPAKSGISSGTAVASASNDGLPSWMHGPGNGGGDDGEAPISWDRSGNGGKGTGRGNGNGRGMGYLSGATRDEPTVLDAPLPRQRDIPVGIMLNPPKKNIRFKVLVRADGSVGSVVVTSSCGQPGIDEFFRGYILAHWKFQPAFVDGKFVDMSTEVTLGGLGG